MGRQLSSALLMLLMLLQPKLLFVLEAVTIPGIFPEIWIVHLGLSHDPDNG
jgi:hypothetical protein